MKKCVATGKTKYSTEEAANKVRIRIWSHDPSAKLDDLHVYMCPHCHRYHVGHKSYYKNLQDRIAGK